MPAYGPTFPYVFLSMGVIKDAEALPGRDLASWGQPEDADPANQSHPQAYYLSGYKPGKRPRPFKVKYMLFLLNSITIKFSHLMMSLKIYTILTVCF